MRGYEIASGAVGREGTRVGDHGTEYDAAIARLRERGNGVSSWGDDGLFGMISAAYAECTQVSLAAFTGLSDEIGGTGAGLSDVSRRASDVEDANARGAAWA